MGWIAPRPGAGRPAEVPVRPLADELPRSDGRTVRLPPTVTIRSHSNGVAARLSAPNDGWFVWRLMGANNRELGRSVSSFPAYSECLDAIAQLRLGAERLTTSAFANSRSGRWGWRIDFEGQAVAACGHWYEREREARSSLSNFATALVIAEIAEGVMTLRDYRGTTARGSSPVGALC
jgi:hypothetical protein